jgi:cytosine/adenosine deaminase-related metal-dependent hydrolase
MFGLKPVPYMESVEWVGNDVWYAHAVHIRPDEVDLFARYRCGVAHCPTSNMRLASGIAPLMQYYTHGVRVGLGVDGSASNDGSNLLAEVRQAMLLSRVDSALKGASLSGAESPPLLSARQALEIATRGGAQVLGRDDIGSIEAGKCADFFAINLNRLDYAGSLHDPLAAVIFCAPQKVDYCVVHGKPVVSAGRLVNLDEHVLAERHNHAARRLLS